VETSNFFMLKYAEQPKLQEKHHLILNASTGFPKEAKFVKIVPLVPHFPYTDFCTSSVGMALESNCLYLQSKELI